MASILIVDDETNIRTQLAFCVRSMGHDVETAEDAASGFERLRAKGFDLVLSDIRMAGMDGLSFLRRIRAQRPEVAIVLMTAYPTVPQAVEAMHAGASEYLTKPFAPEDVRLAINRVLDDRIGAVETPRDAAAADADAGAADRTANGTSPALSLRDLERQHIERVLVESPTLASAAGRLGIDPSTLWRKRRRYGLN
jgi:two-component system response regulator FlrC